MGSTEETRVDKMRAAYVPGHGLLAGKTAVVTAAAGTGIGGPCARPALEGGAKVAGVPCDVTKEDQVQNLFDAAEERFSPVDILVNNAGLGGTAKLTEMTDDQWNKVLDVTLNGTMRCTRAALTRMQPRGSGVIVNNASVIGWGAQER